jgi:hypothetical protein
MKISKIAIAALFAAGFVTVPTTFALGETRDQDDTMVIQCINEYTEEEGYKCIETDPEEGVAYTTEQGDVDVQPIDSCWTTEDGTDVCARGGMVPTPDTGEELPGVPVDPSDCLVSSEAEGQGWMACPGSTEEGDGVAYLEDMPEDRSLMMQNGVAKSAGTPDQTASSTLAAFGVLVAALGALGIGISRQKETN